VYRSIVHGVGAGGPRQPTPCHGSSVLFRFKTYYMGTQYCSVSWQTWKGTSRRLNTPLPLFFFTNTPSGRCQVTATCKQPLMLL
jgi:hypothetical protein